MKNNKLRIFAGIAALTVLLAGCSSKGQNGGENQMTEPSDTMATLPEVDGGEDDGGAQTTSPEAEDIWSTDDAAVTENTTDTNGEQLNTVPQDAPQTPVRNGEVTAIELSFYDVSMEIGDQYMPLVSMYPESASDKSEIWTSSDSSVASVDDMGLITGESEGYATITVKSADSPNVYASVSVRVYDPDSDYDDSDVVQRISLSDYNLTLDVGDTEMPYVTMYPEWADDKSEIWKSSDTSVATVDSKGNVTAVSPGYATITVTSKANDDVYASVSVHVRGTPSGTGSSGSGSGNGSGGSSDDPSDNDYITVEDNDEPGAVKQINLTFYTANMEIGETTMPIVSMYPDDADDKSEIWSSSDTSVATVDDVGNITAVGVGDCIITVKSASNPNVEANVSVRVNTSATEPTYIEGILVTNKTYALPADYAPGVNPDAQAAFDSMAAAAQADGLSLYVVSGYRSYDYQSQIYDNYVAAYGKEEADRFSARPGHSEHQTGLAFDLNNVTDSFANTDEYAWLQAHAHEYGFIIRYPDGKESITGYKFEPWHVRYLGKDTAQAVHDSGLTLEEYLGISSKYSD